MSYPWGLRNLIEKPVRHRVFVSYQHSRDQVYYDAFSRTFHDTHEAVLDNSLERRIDSDDVDYVIRRIREDYIHGTSCTLVLVGAETWGRKYVDWEVKASLDKQHGLIGVQLPTLPVHPVTNRVDVPIRLSENIDSGTVRYDGRELSRRWVANRTELLSNLRNDALNRRLINRTAEVVGVVGSTVEREH